MSDQKSFEELLAEFRNPDLQRSWTREERERRWFEFQMSKATDADVVEEIINYDSGDGRKFVFSKFPALDAMTQLSSIGINITRHDFGKICVALRIYAGEAILDTSKQGKHRERKIAEHAKNLADLLSEPPSEYRYYWGDDVNENDPEPQNTIEIIPLINELRALHNSALESLSTVERRKNNAVEPAGNNSVARDVLFYRLILLAFWKYQLRREIRTSSNEDGDAGGPLIRFMEIMSEGSPDNSAALRQWIDRNKNKVEHFSRHFGEELTLEDLLKPATYIINE